MERMRRARNSMLGIYYVVTACGAVLCLRREMSVYNLLLVLAAALLPLAPYVLYRVCRLRPVYLLEIVFDGFVLAAVPFASLIGGYDFVPYWDKILHFLSGFLFAALGTVVYFSLKPGHALERADAANAALFTWMFAVLSAVLWEIWEYIVSLFGADPQQVAATGVGDTMQDMIVCTLGGLFTAVSCWKYLRHLGENRRPGLMMRLFAAYYRENIAKR